MILNPLAYNIVWDKKKRDMSIRLHATNSYDTRLLELKS